jgi:hypothetical protein
MVAETPAKPAIVRPAFEMHKQRTYLKVDPLYFPKDKDFGVASSSVSHIRN